MVEPITRFTQWAIYSHEKDRWDSGGKESEKR